MLGVFLTVSMIMLDLKIKAKFTASLTRSFNTVTCPDSRESP